MNQIKEQGGDEGNDTEAPWATADGKWYNEAFDGITVLVSKTRLNIGYFNPTERQSVIDPKLSVFQKGKESLAEVATTASKAKRKFDAFYLKSSITSE